jgi:prepilin-type N-terminal cleavage/methylation domain-containing protein
MLVEAAMKRAFTLIELLVVIAIIAILAAILFPVFARTKEAAKKTVSIAQMRQLAAAVMMYAGDFDDNLPPASLRTVNWPTEEPTIWPAMVDPYIKNKALLTAAGTDGTPSYTWATRRTQSIGYSDATGFDPNATATPGNAGPGTEGFRSVASFSTIEESARTGLFATTPNGPPGDVTSKHRGYVFNPYNGMDSPDGDYSKGLPLISDRNLVTEGGDPNYPNSPSFSPGALKPIYCLYFSDNQNNGTTPVIFADGHTKSYSANALNSFGAVVWRFR